jgi:hypothetical protein
LNRTNQNGHSLLVKVGYPANTDPNLEAKENIKKLKKVQKKIG